MQTKLQWDPLVLQPVFRELYEIASKNKKDYIPLMYGVESSEKDTEYLDGVGGEGLMEEWGQSGNQVFYDDINELWKKSFTMKKFSLGRQIERDFVDDLKLAEIRNRITGLADAVYKTQQYQAVETFNNAFLTSTATDFRGRTYNAAGVDGVALCSASHPYSPKDSTTQSNITTNSLSIDAWDSATTAMQEWVDDRGNNMSVMPDTLIVAPYNRRKAFQIAGMPGKEAASYEPDTADHNINIYDGEINVIVNPFLKNRYAWFAVDSTRMKMYHKWFWRRKPENGTITDFDTEVAKYKVIGRWRSGFANYSWVYGANATS